jgi:hypothetical protein
MQRRKLGTLVLVQALVPPPILALVQAVLVQAVLVQALVPSQTGRRLNRRSCRSAHRSSALQRLPALLVLVLPMMMLLVLELELGLEVLEPVRVRVLVPPILALVQAVLVQAVLVQALVPSQTGRPLNRRSCRSAHRSSALLVRLLALLVLVPPSMLLLPWHGTGRCYCYWCYWCYYYCYLPLRSAESPQ